MGRSFSRPRNRWENIKMVLIKKRGHKLHMIQDRAQWWVLVNTIMNFQV
jgi:hypothetical protein